MSEETIFLEGFIEGYTSKPFQELRRENVEIKGRLAAMELMSNHNRQELLEIGSTVKEIAGKVDALKNNGTRLQIQDLSPATGIDALFDTTMMYRHKCTGKGCKRVKVNRHANGIVCTCGKPMVSTPVEHRG
jgi:hypothetical protein